MPVDEIGGGAIVLSMPAVIGLALRYRADVNHRAVEAARHKEREHLARELHDTVPASRARRSPTPRATRRTQAR